MVKDSVRRILAGLVAAGVALFASPSPGAAQDEATLAGDAAGAYAFVSTLEGGGDLMPADGNRETLEANQPLAAGDQIAVDRSGRAELVLPDGGVLRLDGGSALAIADLAEAAGDGDDAVRLDDGSLQVLVDGAPSGDRDRGGVRVDTANATAYFEPAGRYLVETDATGGWTRVVIREGACDLMTERGARRLEAGDEAEVDGASRPRVLVGDAGAWSQIERWGARLDDQARRASVRYVDPSLRYASTQLAYNGNWISLDGQTVWQPRVDTGWRPYWNGRWATTRAGLTWVPRESWGWVTSHYGSWDFRPGFGWVWFPGRRYAPAWVYWYWGPTHVGWCPTGYYTHYYGASAFGSGVRFGVYGWAGGWGGFLDWSFVPVRYLGTPGVGRYCRRGSDLRAELRIDALPRGIITTDTRGAHRWSRPEDAIRDSDRAGWTRPDALPDVSTFIARRRDLAPAVRNQIASVDGQPTLALGRDPGRAEPRPEAWARQRPVERGGEAAGSSPRAGGVVGQPARRDDGGPAAGAWRAPRSAPAGEASGGAARGRVEAAEPGARPRVAGQPAPADDSRARQSPPPADSGAWRTRGQRPSDASRDDDRRPAVSGGGQPAMPATSWRGSPRRSDDDADRGSASSRAPERGRPVVGSDPTPIRRIVEGVRQAPEAPRSDSGRASSASSSRGSDRGARVDRGSSSEGGSADARSARSRRDSDRGQRSRRDAEGGAPPPGGR